MKKLILAIVFLMAALGVFAQNSGRILDISGTVEIKRPGSPNYVRVTKSDLGSQGLEISSDTYVSIGIRSKATIKVGNTVITADQTSRMTLSEINLQSQSETVAVYLNTGSVRVDVNPPAGVRTEMTVSSPVATASVRGTSFEFDPHNVRVSQGTVAFRGNQGQAVSVGQGFSSTIESSGRAAAPVRTSTGTPAPQQAPVDTGSTYTPPPTTTITIYPNFNSAIE